MAGELVSPWMEGPVPPGGREQRQEREQQEGGLKGTWQPLLRRAEDRDRVKRTSEELGGDPGEVGAGRGQFHWGWPSPREAWMRQVGDRGSRTFKTSGRWKDSLQAPAGDRRTCWLQDRRRKR